MPSVGAGAIEQSGEGGVVGREHGDPLAGQLHLAQRIDGDLLQGSPPFRICGPSPAPFVLVAHRKG